MDNDNETAQYLSDPRVRDLILRINPPSYQQFISTLYSDLNNIIRSIEHHANTFKSPTEDELTVKIVIALNAMCYTAEHDANHRGHVDISVKLNNYMWLGEAKIYRSNIWLFKGVHQILNRYSTGHTNETNAGLIIYCFKPLIKSKMENWKSNFQLLSSHHRINLLNLVSTIEEDNCFKSIHKHEISENQFTITHMPVCLYHNPVF